MGSSPGPSYRGGVEGRNNNLRRSNCSKFLNAGDTSWGVRSSLALEREEGREEGTRVPSAGNGPRDRFGWQNPQGDPRGRFEASLGAHTPQSTEDVVEVVAGGNSLARHGTR